MYLKVYKIDGADTIVAACDMDLLNKTIRQGDIEITISDKFYGTEKASEEDLIKALKSAKNANLIGKKVIKTATDCGAIDGEGCIYINGIPHAQIL